VLKRTFLSERAEAVQLI